MKSISKLLLISFSFLMVLSSCKKEYVEEPGNPENEKYYGSWRFTKTNVYDSYQYIAGPTGSELVHIHNETTEWEHIGTISKTPDYGYLRIAFTPDFQYSAIINNSNVGSLTCTFKCNTIANMAMPTGVITHTLTENQYYVNLGWTTGGNGTTNSSYITGVKL